MSIGKVRFGARFNIHEEIQEESKACLLLLLLLQPLWRLGAEKRSTTAGSALRKGCQPSRKHRRRTLSSHFVHPRGKRGKRVSRSQDRRWKALIVDDEELARHVIREFLQSHAEIEIAAECANGIEAVKAVAEHKPNLIFLDVQM